MIYPIQVFADYSYPVIVAIDTSDKLATFEDLNHRLVCHSVFAYPKFYPHRPLVLTSFSMIPNCYFGAGDRT